MSRKHPVWCSQDWIKDSRCHQIWLSFQPFLLLSASVCHFQHWICIHCTSYIVAMLVILFYSLQHQMKEVNYGRKNLFWLIYSTTAMKSQTCLSIADRKCIHHQEAGGRNGCWLFFPFHFLWDWSLWNGTTFMVHIPSSVNLDRNTIIDTREACVFISIQSSWQ